MKIKNVYVIILVVLMTTSLFCADFAKNVEKLMGYNAKSYAMPLIEGFGSSMNSGLYKKASVDPGKIIPIGFDFGIVNFYAFVPDDKMDFAHKLEDFQFDYHLEEGEIQADVPISFKDIYQTNKAKTPNIAGTGKGVKCTLKSEDEIFVTISEKLQSLGISQSIIDSQEDEIKDYISEFLTEDFSSFSFPNGLGVSAMTALALQANVRLPLIGLEVTGRYLPPLQLSADLGEINLFGIGLRKSLPVPIIDVTIGVFVQKLQIGEFFDLDSRMFHAEVGKSIGIPFLFNFSPYAGIGYAQTEAQLDYTLDAGTIPGFDDEQKLKYKIETDDQVVMTIGCTAQIVPLTYLNIELNQSDYLAACLKFGIILK